MLRAMSTVFVRLWAAFLILSMRFVCKALPFRFLIKLISTNRVCAIAKARNFSLLELRGIFAELEQLSWLSGSCFQNSCALYIFLQSFGYDPELWLGCNQNIDKAPAAHAWIECQGLNLDSQPHLGLIPFSAALLK